ncbi:MAG: hypothetical protein ACJ796_01220 [Gemmatimonadaceae bacterium]
MAPPATLHGLLAGAIDYAGLFPPAALSMREAVARYADYRGTAEAWALGRFVVPLARVEELVNAQRESGVHGHGWRLSVLLGDDPVADGARIRGLNATHARSAVIDSGEARISGAASAARDAIATWTKHLPPSLRLFVEFPLIDDPGLFIAAIVAAGACAKIRTGGVTAAAFPDARLVARFLRCCAEHDARFKATAGLHHPWRGSYPLTYESGAPAGRMFGFLNLMIAAAAARSGVTEDEIVDILESERGSDFRFGDDEVRWRDLRFGRQELLESHATFALSFGSCSFEEPVLELRRQALL